MGTTVRNKMSKSLMIKWAVSIGLTAVFAFIPQQGFYTYETKSFMVITVFSLALAAFEIVPMLLISIMMPALWCFFKTAPATVVMAPWMGTTMLLVVGGLFLGVTLEDCGLLRRMAYYLMCKVKGNYFALLVSLMLTSIFLNIVTSGASYLIMAPLAAGLCISLGGMQKKLGAGVAAAIMLGSCTSHAYTYQAAAWGVIMKMGANYLAPTDITPLSIMLHNWPLFFVSLLILWITSKWYKPDEGLGEITYFKQHLEEMGAITRREKVNLAIMILLLVYIFTIKLHGFDINLGFAIIPWLVYLPFLDGADEKAVFKINFSVVFFVAACMSIGTVASSLGLGAVIAQACEALLSGNTSSVMIMGSIFTIVFGLNFLMTPMAIFALLIEPVSMMAVNLGYSPIAFAYAVNACSEAIILPYEYVPYLLVFSFGMISMKDFIKWNIMRSVIFFVGFLTVQVLYWKLIGLL